VYQRLGILLTDTAVLYVRSVLLQAATEATQQHVLPAACRLEAVAGTAGG
jgi:hypothetical protein